MNGFAGIKIYTISVIAVVIILASGWFFQSGALARPPYPPRNQFWAEFFNRPLDSDKYETPTFPSKPPVWTGYENKINISGLRDLNGNISPERFIARWTGSFFFPETAVYKIKADFSGGLKVSFDDEVIIDKWDASASGSAEVEKRLWAGWHKVKVRFFCVSGVPKLNVRWDPPHREIFGRFVAEMYNNNGFKGEPAVVTIENEIAHDFGYGAPEGVSGSPGLGYETAIPTIDYYSVKWTGLFYFDSSSYYRFFISSDDLGILKFDGEVVESADADAVNEKCLKPGVTERGGKHFERFVNKGTHEISFDWYENGGEARAFVKWWKETPPAGPLIKCPERTDTAEIELSLCAVDSSGEEENGIAGYFISDKPHRPHPLNHKWTGISPPEKKFERRVKKLLENSGENIFYVWFKDVNGNMSAAPKASVLLSAAVRESTVKTAEIFETQPVYVLDHSDLDFAADTPAVHIENNSGGTLPADIKNKYVEWNYAGPASFTGPQADISSVFTSVDKNGIETIYALFQDQSEGMKPALMKFDGKKWEQVKLTGGIHGGTGLFASAGAGNDIYLAASYTELDNEIFIYRIRDNHSTALPRLARGRRASALALGFGPPSAPFLHAAIIDAESGGLTIKRFENGSWKTLCENAACGDNLKGPLSIVFFRDEPYLSFLSGFDLARPVIASIRGGKLEPVVMPDTFKMNVSSFSVCGTGESIWMACSGRSRIDGVHTAFYDGSKWTAVPFAKLAPEKYVSSIQLISARGDIYAAFTECAGDSRLRTLRLSNGEWLPAGKSEAYDGRDAGSFVFKATGKKMYERIFICCQSAFDDYRLTMKELCFDKGGLLKPDAGAPDLSRKFDITTLEVYLDEKCKIQAGPEVPRSGTDILYVLALTSGGPPRTKVSLYISSDDTPGGYAVIMNEQTPGSGIFKACFQFGGATKPFENRLLALYRSRIFLKAEADGISRETSLAFSGKWKQMWNGAGASSIRGGSPSMILFRSSNNKNYMACRDGRFNGRACVYEMGSDEKK